MANEGTRGLEEFGFPEFKFRDLRRLKSRAQLTGVVDERLQP
jgi:hypothetical protein